MSSSSTPALERDDQMLTVGQQCSDPTCNLIDFLPLKCQHCQKAYCGDHFLPMVHKCDHYDESKHNRVAPSCPLCNIPIAIPPGEDPNVRMERHFSNDCYVMTGKTPKSSTPHCAKPKCGKVLFAPIRCDKCNQQFCAQHRFPNTHTCTPNASSSDVRLPSGNRLGNMHNQTSAAGAAAVAAVKRAMNNTASNRAASNNRSFAPKQAPAPQPIAKSSSSTSKSSLFSATDRSLHSSRNYVTIVVPSTNNNPTAHNTPSTTHDISRQQSPPGSPKPKSNLLDHLSYVPPPIFGYA